MEWSRPPLNKVYEALGAIGDKRIEVDGNTAKVYSSSRNKYYDVIYDPANFTISSNDNASYYVGYLGYPAIAMLLMKSSVTYDPKLAKYLTGFAWKDINQKFKNDYEKTDRYIDEQIVQKYNLNIVGFHNQLEKILEDIMELNLIRPTALQKPPRGY
jgi:hypothetical protein